MLSDSQIYIYKGKEFIAESYKKQQQKMEILL